MWNCFILAFVETFSCIHLPLVVIYGTDLTYFCFLDKSLTLLWQNFRKHSSLTGLTLERALHSAALKKLSMFKEYSSSMCKGPFSTQLNPPKCSQLLSSIPYMKLIFFALSVWFHTSTCQSIQTLCCCLREAQLVCFAFALCSSLIYISPLFVFLHHFFFWSHTHLEPFSGLLLLLLLTNATLLSLLQLLWDLFLHPFTCFPPCFWVCVYHSWSKMSLPVNSDYQSLERIARYRHACSNGSPYATNKPIDIKPRVRRGYASSVSEHLVLFLINVLSNEFHTFLLIIYD